MQKLLKYSTQPVHIAPLAIFRIIFGSVMLASIIRFMAKGWVSQQYLEPTFFFTYYGFSWVKPLGDPGMHLLFFGMAITAACIMLGLWYRIASPLFFLFFTYGELIDVTNYLNHYYFISLVALLLCFVPAHRYFSLDVLRNPSLRCTHVPAWTVFIFKLQLGIVYFYAGLAKLNPDWLFHAQPLRLWLPARAHLPVIGPFLPKVWVAYLFSWFGAIYDLSIPFLLLYRRTRLLAYGAVIVFHGLTAALFPIGMFPYIMIAATLIFFPESFHRNLIQKVQGLFNRLLKPVTEAGKNHRKSTYKSAAAKIILPLVGLHFFIQALLPFRFALYPDRLFWTEQGYRFSWRVMLMEKAGNITFYVKNPKNGHEIEINNSDYLTPLQEKMMATQPDMILQFAHFLAREWEKKGLISPEVRADSYASLNGRRSQRYIDPEVDLSKIKDSFAHRSWILPYASTSNQTAKQHN